MVAGIIDGGTSQSNIQCANQATHLFHRVSPGGLNFWSWQFGIIGFCHEKVHYLTWGPSKRFQNQPISPMIHLGLILLKKTKPNLSKKYHFFSNLLRNNICFHMINPKRLGAQNMTSPAGHWTIQCWCCNITATVGHGSQCLQFTHQVFPKIWRWHQEDSDVSWWLHPQALREIINLNFPEKRTSRKSWLIIQNPSQKISAKSSETWKMSASLIQLQPLRTISTNLFVEKRVIFPKPLGVFPLLPSGHRLQLAYDMLWCLG